MRIWSIIQKESRNLSLRSYADTSLTITNTWRIKAHERGQKRTEPLSFYYNKRLEIGLHWKEGPEFFIISKIHPAQSSQSSHDNHFNVILAAFKKPLNSRLPMCSLRTPEVILLLITPSNCCSTLFYDLKFKRLYHLNNTGMATTIANFFENFRKRVWFFD